MRFTYLSAISTGLEAIATILSAVKVITFSIKSLMSVPQDNTHANAEPRKGLGIHRWILLAGAVVGALTIAYLETIAVNSKSKKANEPKQQQRVETVYIGE